MCFGRWLQKKSLGPGLGYFCLSIIMRTLRNIFSFAFSILLCSKNFHSGGFGLPAVFFFSYCWKKRKESDCFVVLERKRKEKDTGREVMHRGLSIRLKLDTALYGGTHICHLNPHFGQGLCFLGFMCCVAKSILTNNYYYVFIWVKLSFFKATDLCRSSLVRLKTPEVLKEV